MIPTLMNVVKPPPHTSDYSTSISVTKLPIFGRIHFVRDREGITCVSITALYWLYGTFATLYFILLPQYREGIVSPGFILVYMCVSAGTIISLFRAATLNPGRVPLVTDLEAGADWTPCHVCNRPRPPQAHHCRRCQQCVLRMDHHCPWINNCVGEENHYMFILLIAFAFLLGFLTFILCMLHFWVYPKCQLCDREAFLIKHSIWFLYLLTVMGAVMATVMFFMMVGQHINLVLGRTTLDNLQDPHPDPAQYKHRSNGAYIQQQLLLK
ncbi:palmitoyltransferase ZDHHC21-like isoform X2 [Liolophura sinensis]|uniref:palmitoyltransferase ZDHHC21-like isoform X2 n=1 Tax=Liolophura sinensis TaxID=3198878 RepID=UPI00315972E4